MKRFVRKCLPLVISGVVVLSGTNVFAYSETNENISSSTDKITTISREDLDNATIAPKQNKVNYPVPRASNSRTYNIPGNKGTLTSNAWRSGLTKSGNTYQGDYQVSAEYSGDYTVQSIRATWQGSASLRNEASISLGVSGDSVSAGVSSSWSTVKTVAKYWENNNGSKNSSYRSNMVISPSVDYRSNTVSIVNTARVKLKDDNKPYEISASV